MAKIEIKDTVHYTKAAVEKADDGEFVAVASTSTVDRHGEIVDVEGWDLKNYKKNPVILFGHKHDEPAIGKATRVWIDKTGKNPILKFKAFISDATQRAREIKQLMAEGIMSTFSVSFRAIDAEDNRFTKQELLEISAVNVPANPDAQLLAYKSLKQAGFADKEIADVGIATDFVKALGAMQEKMAIMETQITTAVKGLEHLKSHNGRGSQLVTQRLAVVKSIVRASDKILAEKSMSQRKRERLVKAVKLASESLIVSHKGELNGKNLRTQREASQRAING